MLIAVRNPINFNDDDVYNSSRSAKFLLRTLGHEHFKFVCFDDDNKNTWQERIEEQLGNSRQLTVLYVGGHLSQRLFSQLYSTETAQHHLHGFNCYDLWTSNKKHFLALFGPDPAAASATQGSAEMIQDLQTALSVADVLRNTIDFPHNVALDIRQVDELQRGKRNDILKILEPNMELPKMPLNEVTMNRIRTLVSRYGVSFASRLLTNKTFTHRLPLLFFWNNMQFIMADGSLKNLMCNNDTFIRQISKPSFMSVFKKFKEDYGTVRTLSLFSKPAFCVHVCDEKFMHVFSKIYTEVGEDIEKIFSVTNGGVLFEEFVQRVGTNKTLEFFSNNTFIKNMCKTHNCLSDLATYAEKFGYQIAVSLFSSPTFMALHTESNNSAVVMLISVLYNGEDWSIGIISSLLKSSFSKLLTTDQEEAMNLLQQCIEIFGIESVMCVFRNNIFFTRFSTEGDQFINICRALVSSVGQGTSAALLSCYTFCKYIGSSEFTSFCNGLYQMLDESLPYTTQLLSENCFMTRMYLPTTSIFNQLFTTFLTDHGTVSAVRLFGNGSLCVRWSNESFRNMFDMYIELFGVARTINAFSSQAFVCCFKFNSYNCDETNRITQHKFQRVMTQMRDAPLHSSKFCQVCLATEDIQSLFATSYDDKTQEICAFLDQKRILLEDCPSKFIQRFNFPAITNNRKRNIFPAVEKPRKRR